MIDDNGENCEVRIFEIGGFVGLRRIDLKLIKNYDCILLVFDSNYKFKKGESNVRVAVLGGPLH